MILLFQGCQFVLELQGVSFKEKKKLREIIVKNGGVVSYMLNAKTNFVVVSQKCDTYKTRTALKLGVPIIKEDYIFESDKKRKLLDYDQFLAIGESKNEKFSKGRISLDTWHKKEVPIGKNFNFNPQSLKYTPIDFSNDSFDDYSIGKFVLLNAKDKTGSLTFALEIHVYNEGSQENFRVCQSSCKNDGQVHTFCCTVDSALCAEKTYKYLHDEIRKKMSKVEIVYEIPNTKTIGSYKLRRLLEEMKCSYGTLHPEISDLVVRIWYDAIGPIEEKLAIKLSDLTIDNVINAEISLLNIRQNINEEKSVSSLSKEFYKALPHKNEQPEISSKREVSHLEDFCKLLKDVLIVKEVAPKSSSTINPINFYSSINCSLHWLNPQDKQFKEIKSQLEGNSTSKFSICNIFEVTRRADECQFQAETGNIRTLYHCSKDENFVGILQRGLLLPSEASTKHDITRSDFGKLGKGLYFADTVDASFHYSTQSKIRGTRLMLVNDVALGLCERFKTIQEYLTAPPEGFDSVQGVKGSDFKHDEFVIYNTNQQRIRYLVEFLLPGDVAKDITESIDLKINCSVESNESVVKSLDIENIKDPIEDTKLGLVFEGRFKKNPVKLKEVHVRGKLIDFCSEVVLFQVYKNKLKVSLEAKYVFLLPDNAAVCGFEAFINNKHVVGKVKEKEQAHKEYKEAISQGHGAYLMDQEKPDTFTVSLGNIPPSARVVIKITYIAELQVENDTEPNIVFNIPASIANLEKDSTIAKGDITQTKTTTASVKNKDVVSSLELSCDMPFDIRNIECLSHKVIIKKTRSKACIKMSKLSTLNSEDFVLKLKLAEINIPRMWVEKIKDDDQAAMVVFYPEFECKPITTYEAVILIDMSNSMNDKQSIASTKALAITLLNSLPAGCIFNVVCFGSYYKEAFLTTETLNHTSLSKAIEFIQSSSANFGKSEVIQPLSSLFYMAKKTLLLNVFLISDGNLDNKDCSAKIAYNIFKKGGRVFTMGIGKHLNEHFLKYLALKSGGFYEKFNTEKKFRWNNQIKSLCKKAQQPVLTNARVEWLTHNEVSTASTNTLPNHSPISMNCVFNESRFVAYSFIQNCMQAELKADINGKEFSMIVTASDLSVLKGSTIHRLTAKAIIHDHENENLDEVKSVHNFLAKIRKQNVIDLSTQYDIVSRYTSFVAIEKRDGTQDMSTKIGPSVEEILKSNNVDILSEIEWEKTEEEWTNEMRAINLIRNITITETFSVMQAKELAENAFKMSDQLANSDPLRILCFSKAYDLEVLNNNQNILRMLTQVLIDDGRINYESIKIIMDDKDFLGYKKSLTSLFAVSDNTVNKSNLSYVEKFPVQVQPIICACLLRFHRRSFPELEYSEFLNMLSECTNKFVTTDKTMDEALLEFDQNLSKCKTVLQGLKHLKSKTQQKIPAERSMRLGCNVFFSRPCTSMMVNCSGVYDRKSSPRPPLRNLSFEDYFLGTQQATKSSFPPPLPPRQSDGPPIPAEAGLPPPPIDYADMSVLPKRNNIRLQFKETLKSAAYRKTPETFTQPQVKSRSASQPPPPCRGGYGSPPPLQSRAGDGRPPPLPHRLKSASQPPPPNRVKSASLRPLLCRVKSDSPPPTSNRGTGGIFCGHAQKEPLMRKAMSAFAGSMKSPPQRRIPPPPLHAQPPTENAPPTPGNAPPSAGNAPPPPPYRGSDGGPPSLFLKQSSFSPPQSSASKSASPKTPNIAPDVCQMQFHRISKVNEVGSSVIRAESAKPLVINSKKSLTLDGREAKTDEFVEKIESNYAKISLGKKKKSKPTKIDSKKSYLEGLKVAAASKTEKSENETVTLAGSISRSIQDSCEKVLERGEIIENLLKERDKQNAKLEGFLEQNCNALYDMEYDCTIIDSGGFQAMEYEALDEKREEDLFSNSSTSESDYTELSSESDSENSRLSRTPVRPDESTIYFPFSKFGNITTNLTKNETSIFMLIQQNNLIETLNEILKDFDFNESKEMMKSLKQEDFLLGEEDFNFIMGSYDDELSYMQTIFSILKQHGILSLCKVVIINALLAFYFSTIFVIYRMKNLPTNSSRVIKNIKLLEDFVKFLDKKLPPSLYKTLEQGDSWHDAAVNLITQSILSKHNYV